MAGAHTRNPELFDLAADPSEAKDLAETNPAKVKELQARLIKLAAQAAPPLFMTDAFRLILSEPPSTPGGFFEVSD